MNHQAIPINLERGVDKGVNAKRRDALGTILGDWL